MEPETTLFYVGIIALNAIVGYAMFRITKRYYDRRLLIETEKLALEAKRTDIENEKLKLRQSEK